MIPEARRITRISLEVTFDDGTVMTFAADDPQRPELDYSRPWSSVLSHAGNPFTIDPPAPHRVSVSFESSLRRPIAVEIRQAARQGTAASREVWVAETWRAHGYGHGIHGVYESREAAFEALKSEPGMTVWVDERGIVRGRPRDDERFGATWAMAASQKVQAREA